MTAFVSMPACGPTAWQGQSLHYPSSAAALPRPCRRSFSPPAAALGACGVALAVLSRRCGRKERFRCDRKKARTSRSATFASSSSVEANHPEESAINKSSEHAVLGTGEMCPGSFASRRGYLLLASAAPFVTECEEATALQDVVVDYSIDLPFDRWKVKQQIKQAIRITKERVYEAGDRKTGSSASITRTPLNLGNERGGSDRLQELAGAFDSRAPKSKEAIADVLTRSLKDPAARRQRQWLSAVMLPGVDEYTDRDGQRYVCFGYDVEECNGTIVQYEDQTGSAQEECDGKLLAPKRHFIAGTVIPTVYTSMRKQEGEANRSKLVESLWLLDVSAPVGSLAADGLEAALKKTVRSFAVAQPSIQGLPECEGKTMTDCFGEAWSGRGTLYRGTNRASLSDTVKYGGGDA
eukprot:TRINITY_DN39837_c0_g1_i1.p1 TRINITY_DN39837_c0_g1~~TRINITY_DN39837_c0_g1_i1.p1  ORF type:complete len:409 (+),score=50.13 TRINITY_DN39837_c0_g1_i1:86-1312(+)